MYQNIYYMMTIECNQRCTKCTHWKHKDKANRLSVDRLVDGIKSISTAKELCLVGGEPLIFKSEVYKILQGIADTSLRTVIVTNGILMNREFIEIVAKYDIHLVVSIDTLDRDFWEFVRGAKSYDKTMRNFEHASNVLESSQLSIQSVLSEETRPYLESVAAYAEKMGVYHSVQNYIAEGFGGSWTPVDSVKVVDLDSGVQCFAADRNISVTQNGDVYTCFQQSWIRGCEKPLGNLNWQTMPEILSSNYVQFVNEKMRACNLPCKVLKCNTKDKGENHDPV